MKDNLPARHWIDREWVSSLPEKSSINPATGDVIGTYCEADIEVAKKAVQVAVRTFRTTSWSTDAMARAKALAHLADAFEERLDELIDSLCLENGKLRPQAAYEVHHIDRALRFAAGLAVQNFGRVADTEPGIQSMAIRTPIGVAGIIVPWNSPAYLCIRALAPALAAGCTAVVKMPAQAAQTAALFSEIVGSVAEIPSGAVNVLIESGSDGARHLVDSPDVPVISFTGSTRTGRMIAQAAAVHLKRVGLELGGKTPHLIFDDADIDALIPTVARSSTVFAGQFCMTGSRILAQRGVAAQVESALAARLRAVRPGPASDPASEMGPMIDMVSVARVDKAVEEAIASGSRVIVRGGPATDPGLTAGAFYHPTLLEVPDSSLPIVQQEIFGPVQTLQIFDTEDEAVALANDTEYGLSACIWSNDVNRPMRIARRLDAGMISINSWANLAIEFEEGGFKASGLGRLGGTASLDDFCEYKQITQTFA